MRRIRGGSTSKRIANTVRGRRSRILEYPNQKQTPKTHRQLGDTCGQPDEAVVVDSDGAPLLAETRGLGIADHRADVAGAAGAGAIQSLTWVACRTRSGADRDGGNNCR